MYIYIYEEAMMPDFFKVIDNIVQIFLTPSQGLLKTLHVYRIIIFIFCTV